MRFCHAKLTTTFTATIVLVCGVALTSRACTLCIGFPEKTATDHLLEADCVVLARPSAGNAFSYARGERIKGVDNGSKIDLLVDSRTRRLLLADPNRHVVLVHNERDGGWRNLGIVSDDYLSILRRIAVFGADWEGADGVQRRWRFFLPLFGHDDPSIRELAYLEAARAPYRVIRQLGRVVPRDAYASLLDDPKYLEWRSLAILLLAQSDDPGDRLTIRKSYAAASRLRMTTNLGAWAAALIEIDGASALASIEEAYLRSPRPSAEELNAIRNALSMHGRAADPHFQGRIIASYRLLLTNHPRYAPQVAADLTAWGRRDLKTDVSACLDRFQSFDINEKTTIQRYVRRSMTSEELALVSE